MVAKTTDEHFAEYSSNTRIKHEILKRYLKAYLTALSRTVDAIHYIDGFAGRGTYADTTPGSPILALNLLGQQQQPYCASFVEAQSADADDLRSAVAALAAEGPQLEPPLVLTGEFADHIDALLTRPALRPFARVATFAFVDPCRVKGVKVKGIQKILAMPYGECLIFWNYDGVNRWLGAIAAGRSSGKGLKDLFGDTTVLRQAIELAETVDAPAAKERGLLSLMLKVLQDQSDARYVLPFRFDARDANRTSHYLIHCSRHALAFKFMKQVMSSLTSSDEPGRFEFLREVDVANQADLFVPASDVVAAEQVLEVLRDGPRPVKLFYEDWVRRPSDFFTQSDYRRLLLTMEERQQIEVLDSDGTTSLPRNKRRQIKG
ncbi:MAG TPA: three-Cys-motif partner protein TcmP, partial [Steroidobacteraceae bacterium]|nr:three-Cys-motif partner protein TcmP [Steroidobacteraceae bacterium]